MEYGKTIKQIADELGVSKQAVHQKRKSKGLATALQPFTTTVDGVVYISVDGEKLIKSAFSENNRKQVDGSFTTTVDGSFTPEERHETATEALIAMLQRELEIKNKQIEDLSAALVAAQRTAQAAQALHAGTIRQQLTDGAGDPEELDRQPKPSFLRKLFRKG